MTSPLGPRTFAITARWLWVLTAMGLLVAQVDAGVDTDANGLSDVFEFVYFQAAVDPRGDPDQDGFSTWEESIWGADPTSAGSGVRGATVHVEAAELVLEWPAVVGKRYQLQVSTDLQVWNTVGEGGTGRYRAPLAAGEPQFWRVQVFAHAPDTDGDGLDDWETALWVSRYGRAPAQTDLDADGLADAAEFSEGRQPNKPDHPAVGLVVFTPLEP